MLGCATVAAAIGLTVLAGWALRIPQLVTWFPGHVTVKANTAVGLLAAGVALFARERWPDDTAGRRAGTFGAFVVLAIGAATLAEYGLGRNLGIDELLFREVVVGSGTSHAGRMAPNSALGFSLMGTALVTAAGSHRARQLGQACALATLLLTLIAAVGYAYGAHVLIGLFSRTRMAVPTTLGFAALCLGTLFADTENGFMAEVTAATPGGTVARRLLPAAFLVPTVVGITCLQGFRAGLYDPAFAAAIMAVAETISFATMVWTCARFLNESGRAHMLANIDELTGLLNRRAFFAEGENRLVAARQSETAGLLFFVDIDGMKEINDALGHAAGDKAIVEIAAVLRSVFRDGDAIARLGGDEFVVLASGATLDHEAALLARLDAALARRNELPHRVFALRCSTGVTRYDPRQGVSIAELLKTADAEMYRRKQSKRRSRSESARWSIVAPAMARGLRHRS